MEVVNINNIVCRGRPIDTISSIIDEAVGVIKIYGQEDLPSEPMAYPFTRPNLSQTELLDLVPTPQKKQAETHILASNSPKSKSVPLAPVPQSKEADINVSASADTPIKQSPLPPPPGVREDGTWGHISYTGQTTYLLACLSCLFICLPGFLVLCCPQDKQIVYMVDNKVYDETGNSLGDVERLKFIPKIN